jgi:branched-chain amino acid transport system permease protein
MIAGLARQLPPRTLALLALLAGALLVAPLVVDSHVLSILILILYFAYVGQAWNVMMGFAGQLSLGHALYVGVAAYVSAALFVHFGIGPWLGMLAAIAVAALCGAGIGFLAFRFGIGGVYFALLTIAFAEFSRILFDHIDWVGGSSGFFLPVESRERIDILDLRGPPLMFYYLMLVLTAAAFALCAALARSRAGYYWQAIREDQDAAQALGINTFRYKIYAVALSAGMTALGGIFIAFYNNNLFPEQIFNIERSIEVILGPIIGGLGTLFGPILGAFVLTTLAELLTALTEALGWQIPGIRRVFYGFCLLAVIIYLPNGIWPWLAGRFRLVRRGGGEG